MIYLILLIIAIIIEFGIPLYIEYKAEKKNENDKESLFDKLKNGDK